MIASFLFFFLAAAAIAAAIGMVVSRNPVSSALWLILNLFCVAGLYLTLHASFIAVIQVMVYAGAIMVLFLFVIMLLNLTELPHLQGFNWQLGAAFLLGLALLAQLGYTVALGLGAAPEVLLPELAAETGSAGYLAVYLFTEYALPLEMIGVLLLAATVGAVILARRKVT